MSTKIAFSNSILKVEVAIIKDANEGKAFIKILDPEHNIPEEYLANIESTRFRLDSEFLDDALDTEASYVMGQIQNAISRAWENPNLKKVSKKSK